MTLLAHAVMFGWIPLALVMFAVLPLRRAILVSYLGAFLFLPNATYELSGVPDYTKITASGLAVLLGVLLFHPRGILSFRPRWYDIPMIVFCFAPVATSILNDLGIYDGLSNVLDQLVSWGLPYVIGRVYFSSRQGMYELAVGLFLAGLVYVPFCLWEIRMSPNLHFDLYGFRSRNFGLGLRYGGYRPIVFMWSYIPVANLLSVATMSGFWLWWSGRMVQLAGVPTVVLTLVLLGTMLLTQTLGAAILLSIAAGVLLSRGALSRPTLVKVLVLAVPVLIGVRATGIWRGEELVSLAAMVNEERAASLEYRIGNENILAEKALQRPFFGWGGWGRARVYDESGRDISTTDGLWIIVLGGSGLVGLSALLALFVIPVLRFDRRFPGRSWLRRDVAPAAVGATLVLMAFVNNVPNVTANPLVVVALGAIGAYGDKARRSGSGRGDRPRGRLPRAGPSQERPGPPSRPGRD